MEAWALVIGGEDVSCSVTPVLGRGEIFAEVGPMGGGRETVGVLTLDEIGVTLGESSIFLLSGKSL